MSNFGLPACEYRKEHKENAEKQVFMDEQADKNGI
jgi:hypothetical protein